jgi:hypothetical protein
VFLPLPSTLFHDSPIGTVTRLLAARPRKRDSIPGRVRNFIRASTTTLWSTQIHIKVLSLRELRLPGRPAGDLTHLVARLMCGTTHPFLHMPSCRVQGKLWFTSYRDFLLLSIVLSANVLTYRDCVTNKSSAATTSSVIA